MNRLRRICFVTGTRAEFGLMRSTLAAIAAESSLALQIIATGMHLDPRYGHTVDDIAAAGFTVDRTVPWLADGTSSNLSTAVATGEAIAGCARALDQLQSDVVIVVGDRVEAFAGATAAALLRKCVAHVHGGDRALGQVDDALRHAITKLAHVHFPATRESAARIRKLGEDAWRIHCVGTPGLDDVPPPAAEREAFALMAFHPTSGDDAAEARKTSAVLDALDDTGVRDVHAIGPNNDPGSPGVWQALREREAAGRLTRRQSLPRGDYLRLLARCGVLIGNSSSGIIEAASAGCYVIDVGPRQAGREHGGNVIHVGNDRHEIAEALRGVWSAGTPRPWRGKNVYGSPGAGRRIASTLRELSLTEELLRKLIAY